MSFLCFLSWKNTQKKLILNPWSKEYCSNFDHLRKLLSCPMRPKLVATEIDLSQQKLQVFGSNFSRLEVFLKLPNWHSTLVTPLTTKFVMCLVDCWTSPTQTTRLLICPFWQAKLLNTTPWKLVKPPQPTQWTLLV